jgi:thioredoxin 1
MAENLTPSKFNQKIKAGITAIEFWAPWCAPCRKMKTVFERVESKFSEIKFGRINVDECRELASKWAIVSIPTLIVFSKGKEAERFVGVAPKEVIENELRTRLAK